MDNTILKANRIGFVVQQMLVNTHGCQNGHGQCHGAMHNGRHGPGQLAVIGDIQACQNHRGSDTGMQDKSTYTERFQNGKGDVASSCQHQIIVHQGNGIEQETQHQSIVFELFSLKVEVAIP
eukprot:scaffold1506_cov179-Amphora_coffeaeformis.AAC.20